MNKTTMFVLKRNFVLVSKSGRAIDFVKDRPTHVPPDLIKEAIGIGALPAEGDVDDFFKDSELTKAPSDPLVRANHILEIIYKLVERNDRDDFTAAGLPNSKVISRQLGWRVNAVEVGQVYKAYCEEKAVVSEQARLDARSE